MLKCEPETIKDDCPSEYLLAAEEDAGHPLIGESFSKSISIDHPYDDSNNQGTK